MNFKKRVNGSWTDTPYYIHNTSTDTITTPADIYVNDTTATVGLKGNMSQSSTPTPDNPVMPRGTGERTGNLLPLSDKTFTIAAYSSNLTVTCNGGNLYLSGTVGEIPSNYNMWKTNFAFELEAGTYYCNSPSPLGSNFGRYIKKYDDDSNLINSNTYIFTLAEKTKCYLSFYIYQKSIDSKIELMLNLGSTALPYENFGYKIPILSANTTTPVYLGEVQTTRRIKKYEITGNERWVKEPFGDTPNRYHGNDILSDCGNNMQGVCSHYIYAVANAYGNIFIASNKTDIFVLDENITSAQALSKYLAQQYAAGTPVTVWYVLATPTTGIVNEPIRKIGNYADTVSGITIPTIAGANTISVGTTLQPSEVSVNYHGWHPVVDVHERESGAWT